VRPSLSAFVDNLRRPVPSGRWLYLLVRNLGLRVMRRQNCCGHPGEPGC
jgi:hypothetical protein